MEKVSAAPITAPRLRYEPWWRRGGYLLIAAVIYFSLTRHAPEIKLNQGDKLGHFLAYGSLMFWFAQLDRPSALRWCWAIVFVALGITLECVQGMTDYRSFDPIDMLANTTGVFLGWLFALPLNLFARVETALARGR